MKAVLDGERRPVLGSLQARDLPFFVDELALAARSGDHAWARLFRQAGSLRSWWAAGLLSGLARSSFRSGWRPASLLVERRKEEIRTSIVSSRFPKAFSASSLLFRGDKGGLAGNAKRIAESRRVCLRIPRAGHVLRSAFLEWILAQSEPMEQNHALFVCLFASAVARRYSLRTPPGILSLRVRFRGTLFLRMESS